MTLELAGQAPCRSRKTHILRALAAKSYGNSTWRRAGGRCRPGLQSGGELAVNGETLGTGGRDLPAFQDPVTGKNPDTGEFCKIRIRFVLLKEDRQQQSDRGTT